ncbi:hypothetical protein BDD12DRAFT_564636 [Trichophaea hybrida]|nr:hypothetical protein BDD12DRAFT_564636 [Trichophaea hybrida]
MSQMDQKAPQPGQNMNINMNNMGGMVGGAPGMEHGAAPRGSSAAYDGRQMLNTYIYDYFCKNNMFECANALLKTPDAEVQTDLSFRPSPSRRPQKHESDGGMNGIDDESMDGSDGQRHGDDGDDVKNIKDLPPAKVPTAISGSFLLEWWCCFMDIYWARAKGNASSAANAYVSQTQAQQRLRNEQLMRMNPNNQAALMGQQMNMPGGYPARMMAGGMNGVVHGGQEGAGSPGDMAHKPGQQQLQRSVLQKLTAGRGPHQMNPLGRPQLIQHMQNREGEVNDMNGQQRPQSPAAAAASPGNKRVRLENGQYEPVGNGRGVTPQANGINPNTLSAAQFQAFQGQPAIAQQRSIQAYAQNMAAATGKNIAQLQGGPKGIPQNPGQAGSPMMPQTSEGGLGGGMGDFYAGPSSGMRTGLSGTGNHALQDYQMQLMLLEQQNKKRLMQARQEQDHIATHGDGNRPNTYHQSMSPNSRAAPSPGPGGKPMTGTPKIPNQVGPGSPLPDGQMGAHVQQRNSPASAAGFNGQMSEGSHSMINYQMGNNGAPNGAGMMRPPGGFEGQMAQPGMAGQMNPNMRAQQAGRGQQAGGIWHPQQQQQQQQMLQQQQGQPQSQQPGQPQQNQPPQQVGTPQPGRQNLPHTAMPPPQAPPNVPNTGRPAPASPQVTNHPPTPTQSNKPNPKGKTTREPAKKVKKGAAPSTQAPSAVTPTSEPLTPTTPQNPNSFAPNHTRSNFTSGGPNQPGNTPAGQPVQQPTPNTAPAAPSVIPDSIQPTSSTFGSMGDIGVDFGGTFDDGSADLLDNFDFDSFLNTTEDNNGALGFGSDSLQWNDNSNEVGAGDS